MISGSPYQQLTAINGARISPSEQLQEKRKLAAAIARRRHETPGERQRRIAAYRADRRRDHQLMNQLTAAFDFKLVGTENLEGRRVYDLQATPRPGYRPPNRDTRVLTGMRGELWIDTQTFQWVKVEAHVIHPVWIEGFIARVEPGTRFELEYRPVSDGVWLPSHYQMQATAKVLFVFSHHDQADQAYYDYRKAGPPAE
ncbi:MAG TPA: hypothetical protein VMI94_28655 [Bryobacteraceae bacterium]|nr:hypothetical protein [Bryobacteraceae bacterium]